MESRLNWLNMLNKVIFHFNFFAFFLISLSVSGFYGISEGCVGKCQSNPCLNNGTCIEKYNGYSCDCQWTAFKGPICADEIGVNLRSDYYIRYDFETSISTLEEYIRVGFTTTEHKGLIFGMTAYSNEYLNLLMSTSGKIDFFSKNN